MSLSPQSVAYGHSCHIVRLTLIDQTRNGVNEPINYLISDVGYVWRLGSSIVWIPRIMIRMKLGQDVDAALYVLIDGKTMLKRYSIPPFQVMIWRSCARFSVRN